MFIVPKLQLIMVALIYEFRNVHSTTELVLPTNHSAHFICNFWLSYRTGLIRLVQEGDWEFSLRTH